jgi:PRC-barrel domain
MRTKLFVGLGAFAALAAAIAVAQETIDQPVAGQDQATETQTTDATDYSGQATTTDEARHRNAYKASELLGLNIRGREGDDDIGEISDLMIGHDGKVVYAAVSFGGFLGLGDKMFAVPFEAVEIVRTDDDIYARMDVSEETLKNMEGFNQDNWPEQPNRNFRSHVGQRHAELPATDVDVE